MVSRHYKFASIFLWVSGVSFLAVFALPLLLAPLVWARAFEWPVPDETALTVYLGRCLGAMAFVTTIFAIRAAPYPEKHVWLFQFIAMVTALMTTLHIWGAVMQSEPDFEVAEIVLYAVVTLAACAAGRSAQRSPASRAAAPHPAST